MMVEKEKNKKIKENLSSRRLFNKALSVLAFFSIKQSKNNRARQVNNATEHKYKRINKATGNLYLIDKNHNPAEIYNIEKYSCKKPKITPDK